MAPTTPTARSTTSPITSQPLAPRRLRPPKPSVKARENQENLRSYATRLRSAQADSPLSSEEPTHEPTRQETRDSKLDTLARLVETLNETITQQSSVIDDIRAELVEIKLQQQVLQALNEELHEEIRALRTRADARSPAVTSATSWASVAAGGRAQQTESGREQSTSVCPTNQELNCVRISTKAKPDDTEPDAETFARYLPTVKANKHIRDALQRTEATKEAQVAGVGTTKTGYVIRFKDARSTEQERMEVGYRSWAPRLSWSSHASA